MTSALLLVALLLLVECSYLLWIRRSAARRRAAVGSAPVVDLAQMDAAERDETRDNVVPMRKQPASAPHDVRRSVS